MAQDVGSAILAGIQGVQANAQRRFQNQLAREEMDLARQRAAREQEQLQINKDVNARAERLTLEQLRTTARNELTASADKVFGRGQALGVIKKDGSIDRDALARGIKSGDQQYARFAADVLNVNKAEEAINRSNFDPQEFTYTGIDPEAFKQGQLVAIGSYRDGRPGVLTLQGGSGSDENVISKPLDEGVDLIIEGLQTRVIPNSNMGATSAESRLNVARNVGDTISTAFSNRPPVYAGGARTVLNAIDASGLPVEASRTFISQLSAIKDPREKQEFIWRVAKDFGVEAEVQTRGGASSTTLGVDRQEVVVSGVGEMSGANVFRASSTVKGFDNRISAKRQQANKLAITDPRREKLETEISDLATQKADFIRTENQNTWSSYEADAKKAEEALAKPNVTAESRAYWNARKQDVDKKKQAFIKAGGYTPVTRTTDYAALEQNVISRIKELSPSDVATAIQSGVLKFSEPEIRALRARLTEAGVSGNSGNAIRTASRTLPREEIIGTLAVAYAQSNDSGQQQQLMTMIANTAETGSPFLSDAKRRDQELEAAQIAATREATAQRAAQSDNDVRLANIQALDKALGEGAALLNPVEDGKPVKGNIDNATRWTTTALPRNQAFIRQMARLDPVAAREYYRVHMGQASQAASIIFDEMPSPGFFGSGKDFLYDWFGDKPTADTMATRLQNVRVVAEKGSDGVDRVKAVYLVNRGTGRQEGKEITASQLQNIDGGPEFFQILATAGVINENIASGRAAANARK